MNTWKYVKKSLIYYRRTHLGVVLGAALSTAVLLGSLVLGDSVRDSLKQLVLDRLGRTTWAMQTGDRFFQTSLAERLAEKADADAAPLLQTRGVAVAGSEYRVNKVQVVGVDQRFDLFGGCDLYAHLAADEVVVNERLAKKLHASPGDEILLRIEKLDAMPRDAPLAGVSDAAVAQRLRIKAVASAKEFGRFSLRNNQVEPYTAFLSLSRLQAWLDLPNKANVMLVAAPEKKDMAAVLSTALSRVFTLSDAGFRLVPLAGKVVELRSDRIFIDPPLAQRLSRLPGAIPVSTYLVNELRLGDRMTPYSFVSTGESVGLERLGDDDMVVNDWLAKDLNARPGDEMTMTWFRLGPMRRLIEDTTTFRVKRIVPLAGPYADADLMPDFPGLADEENCRDWDAGVPIDYDKIRDKDERYWDDYRGAPKAFISLKRAKALWGNRFGDLTAIRFSDASLPDIENKLQPLIDPVDFGFVFVPVRRLGLQAAQHSVDFAGLFIGLSFFLIVAALMLTGLLFVFGVEQRSQETGLLLAVGFTSKNVKKLILAEGAALAVIGALIGILLGLLFHQLVLMALKTIWRDIVGATALRLYVKPTTVLLGVGSGLAASMLSLWLAARRQANRTIADLQKGVLRVDALAAKKPTISRLLGVVAVAAVIVVLLLTPPGRGKQASVAFFSAGALLLIGGLAFTNIYLTHLARGRKKRRLDLSAVGRRNNARRRSRSLTLVGILAAGVFLTFTVGANRTSASLNAEQRSSGTGGFALWGETTMPVLHDLNSPEGRDFYGLDLDSVRFVQLKVKEGDEASCLNLHRVATPRLLGVDAAELDRRGAFSFAERTDDVDAGHPWRALDIEYDGDVIPGVADQTVILWSLGKQIGDTLSYVDENGRPFRVRLVGGLANSVFQGNLLISRENFIKHYPSVGGSRVLLVDAPFDAADEVAKKLTWALQDVGLDLTPTAERLAEFNKVTNTYLSIFMILGGLGLILGSIGIGIVLLRNVMERRNELAIMRALGFDSRSLRKMVYSEHVVLLLLGILVGVLSALFAVLPALMTPGASIPYMTMAAMLAVIVASGLWWTKMAAAVALRGDLLPALRNE